MNQITLSKTFDEFEDTATASCSTQDGRGSSKSVECYDCALCSDLVAGCSTSCPNWSLSTIASVVSTTDVHVFQVSVQPTDSGDVGVYNCRLAASHTASSTVAFSTDTFKLTVTDCTTPCSEAVLLNSGSRPFSTLNVVRVHLGAPAVTDSFAEFEDSLSSLCPGTMDRCRGSTYELKCICTKPNLSTCKISPTVPETPRFEQSILENPPGSGTH